MTSLKVNVSQHPVKSVTVFQSSTAEVVRTLSLDLKAGQNTVEISGLPSCIDTESVRVSGLGGAARLFDVVSKIKRSVPFGNDDVSDTLSQLKRKKTALEDEKNALQTQTRLLSDYAQLISSQYVTPDDALKFFDTLATRKSEGSETIKELTDKIAELDGLIFEETEKKKGEARGHVTVVIVAKNACTVELKLTYLVTRASWEPCYDLLATTANGQPAPSVSLHYRARITQSTGEHWTNAILTLSTSSSQALRNANIPDIKQLTLRRRSNFISTQQRQVQSGANPVSQLLQRQNQLQTLQGQDYSKMGFPKVTPFGEAQALQPTPVYSGTRFSPQSAHPNGGLFGGALFGNQATNAAFGGFGTTQTGASAMAGPIPATSPRSTVRVPTIVQRMARKDSVSSDEEDTAGGPASDENSALEYTFIEGGDDSAERAAEDGPISEGSAAVLRTSPLATAYRVEGSATIPSDGVAHKVFVAALDFVAEMTHVCVPRVRAAVFIQCKVKNTSEYNLLPGPVSVLLDDSYVSKFSLQSTGTNDTFTCTLGVDTSLRVMYERSSKTTKDEQHAFAENTKKTTVMLRTKIENRHTSDIPSLVVREAIPTAEDEQFKVVLRTPAGLSTAKEGEEVDVVDPADGKKTVLGWKVRWSKDADGKSGEREGKFEWVGKLAAGETSTLEAQWEVRVPAGVSWDEVVQHFSGPKLA